MNKQKILSYILIFALTIASFAFPTNPVYADNISYPVADETINFDTGNGADGNVEFRVDPNDSNKAQMLVNGTVVFTTTTKETFRGDMLNDNRANFNVFIFNLNSITTHLPTNKTYSPSFSAAVINGPTLTGVPNFNNLTVGDNCLITTTTKQPLAFKVQGTLALNGVLRSRHGDGGTGFGGYNIYPGNGENGQSIAVLANNITVNSTGVVYPFGGGGGAASRGYTLTSSERTQGIAGGTGGKGGNTFLYANSLTNNGLITSGNGGGGGGGSDATYWGSYRTFGDGGQPGNGGDLYILSNNFANNSYIYSGYSGQKGGAGYEQDVSWDNGNAFGGNGGAGAGGGGSGQTSDAGAGTIPAYGATNGLPGNWTIGRNITHSYTYTRYFDSTLYSYVVNYHYYDGAPLTVVNSQNGTAAGNVTIKYNVGTDTGNIGLGFFSTSKKGNSALNISTNGNLLVSLFNKIKKIGAGTNNIKTKGNLTITAADSDNYNSNNITVSDGRLTIENAKFSGTANVTNGDVIVSNVDIGTLTVNSTGDVRIRNISNMETAPYWTSRTLTVNGLRVLRVQPAAKTNDLGIITLTLDEWKNNYASGANGASTTQMMDFAIEKATEDDPTFTRVAEFSRSLSSIPEWKDMGTVVGKKITYRVGYKNPTQTGYIFIEPLTITTTSEGGGGLDEAPPTIAYFQVADGKVDTDKEKVPVQVMATDNRTQQSSLRTQIQVNDKYYIFNNGTFVEGTKDSWSGYFDFADNLPLIEGQNQIVLRVKDEAGNTAVRMATILYVKKTGSIVAPNIDDNLLNPNAPADQRIVVITNPVDGSQITKKTTIKGREVWVTENNLIELNFDKSKLPANVAGLQYSLSGDQYSKPLGIDDTISLQLPPTSGLYMVKVLFLTDTGITSTKPSIMYVAYDSVSPSVTAEIVGKATLTTAATVNVYLKIKDNLCTTFEWSLNGTDWSDVPIDGIASVPLSNGFNNKKIYVRDAAGNSEETSIYIWKK